jgi:hypothetical protein
MRNQKITHITLAAVLILMATGSAVWANQAIQPAPKLVMEKTQHSFEPVVDGTKVSHDFVVRNEGDAVLKILKVKTS